MIPALVNYFDIKRRFDPDFLRQEIEESITLRGVNTWLLICSAMLASIGLDVNSTAVIIGAMLVSPLMSPILGIGLGVGTLDRELIFRSLSSLSLKVISAYAAASIYFALSPFDALTPEMEARTAPTVLDVMIAFFGGVAGIVSLSQNKVSNAIPGVAIATALMPPLCTSAYGFVHQDYRVMGGAFYLFFINAVFISFATLLIVRYFNMPAKKHLGVRQRNKAILTVALFLLVTVLPGFWFLYQTLLTRRTEQQIQRFISTRIERQDVEVLANKIITDPRTGTRTIKLFLYSKNNVRDSIPRWIADFNALNLSAYRLQITRTNISKAELEPAGRSADRLAELEKASRSVRWFDYQPTSADAAEKNSPLRLKAELKTIFPELRDFRFGTLITVSDSSNATDTLVVCQARKTGNWLPKDSQRLHAFLKNRLEADSITVRVE
jgi:uncharacterized hydrophobic protein (TIGR00271 family)